MKKLLRKLISLAFVALLCAVAFYGFKGYLMYKDATSEVSVSEKVREIRRRENYVTIDEIPEIYKDALICVEDRKFYDHSGIDIFSLTRAAIKNISDKEFSQGGSTITQQLAKNLFFTHEKSLTRKAAELFVVHELEDRYSKDVILELYINTVYYGDGYYSLYDASKGYYDCEPQDLTDFEATYLAGVPNAPSVFAPTKKSEAGDRRHEVVLSAMVDCDKITEDYKNEILSER